MSKYYYNKDYFKKIDTQDKAYWLGFLYADCSINRFYKNDQLKSMTLEIGLSAVDKRHLEKFRESLNSNIPIKDRISKIGEKEYKSVRMQVNCTKLCYDLCELGCTPSKTFTLQFPNDDIVPRNLKRHFIRGFFDGDGCISTSTINGKPHIFTLITGASVILNGIADFLIEEKVLRKRPKFQHDKRNNKVISMIIYGTDTNKEWLDYLYRDSEIYLDRKHQKYVDFYNGYDEKNNKRGVYYDKHHDVYIATIYIDGRRITSRHKTIEEAIEARKEAEIKKMNMELPT